MFYSDFFGRKTWIDLPEKSILKKQKTAERRMTAGAGKAEQKKRKKDRKKR